MAAKKSQVDYSLRLASDKPWEDSDDDAAVREYVQRIKHDYYEADAFKKYKKRCETLKYLVNQLWENGKKTTKFGFRLAMMRATYDNYRDAMHDLFDLDEWVYLTCMNHDPQQKQYVDQLQGFINNLLRQINYKRMWYRRIDYLPDYGWSPAFGEFQYGEGYELRANKDYQTAGQLPFNAAWATILNKPASRPLHPYAWFTSSPTVAEGFSGQGYMKRWYLRDVYAAEKKQTKDGKPLYNPKAIAKLKEMLGKKQQERDPNMPESRGSDINDQDLRYDQGMKEPYVDVTYFHGCIGGCRGHYDDPAVYTLEVTKGLTLRFAEDPLGYQYEEITHAKTHAYRSSPFSRSLLDGTREHQRMSDLLLNLGIENQVDAMHRFWWLNEDDLLDPNDFYNPRGLNTFVLAGRENARAPQMIEGASSRTLQDMQQLFGLIRHDQQLGGMSDQEAGLGQQGGPGGEKSTATEASILKSANSKKVRATCKRISEEAMIPEIKYLTLQALLFYTPQQLRATTKDGQVIPMTDAHFQAFVSNAEFRVNDHVTRDSDSEALKSYNFWMSATKLSQQLGQPEYAIKIIRAYGKKLGIEELDDILPEPQLPTITSQGPGGPALPGQPGAVPAAVPGMPGAPGLITPPAPAPEQATFAQPQAGNFNVAVAG